MKSRSVEDTGIPIRAVRAWCRHLTREFQKNAHLEVVFSFMVLEWKSPPPSPSPSPSTACRRFSVPTSLDRNLPIFFFLPLFFFFTSPLFPFAASGCLPAACFLIEVGISGCEKAATLTKEAPLEGAPPRTWTELTSAESAAAWWGGGDEPPEE